MLEVVTSCHTLDKKIMCFRLSICYFIKYFLHLGSLLHFYFIFQVIVTFPVIVII